MSIHEVTDEDAEDILAEALEFLGGKPVIENNFIRYGSLVLTLAPKANSLLADHLFSPALFLAERIERGLLHDLSGKTVVELGAGTALPSLLLSIQANPPSLLVVTDYPDPAILGNVEANVQRNAALVKPGCTVKCEGYEWGTDPLKLLEICKSDNGSKGGYDVMILSDLLHFFDSHDVLLSSISMLLARTKEARVFIGAGSYTRAHVCENFLQKGEEMGLCLDEIIDNDKWLGTLPVSDLDLEALSLRKNNCRYWVGRWSDVPQLTPS
ncbi:Protein N-terminal and lysine N-methyltransferase EFM7 [Psilocybe cubensis]|uniref:Protein N-terminal and lysine N-methyltransferase EFM7 n=1 Tax=Psilocybe cubensis TaxID=181762 RepID=A0ACB8GT08_PSICU|nr:Protein N-terminal and lysine N-methyltransferase EFM7 [Psilocybe cubensis]KAH9478567.1 Protein N-terminal and lysine N-methyltransferase EFM7 [Psilocybe cubensis]